MPGHVQQGNSRDPHSLIIWMGSSCTDSMFLLKGYCISNLVARKPQPIATDIVSAWSVLISSKLGWGIRIVQEHTPGAFVKTKAESFPYCLAKIHQTVN